MKTLKKILAALVLAAIAAFIPFAVHAQRAGTDNQRQQQMMQSQIRQRTPQSMMGNMNQSMMSLNEMMQHMQKIMNTTTKMVQTMHDDGQANAHNHSLDAQMKAMVGRDELEKVAHGNKNAMMLDNGNQQTMNMMQGIDDMAKNMNKVMEQMHKIMSDQKLMSNPGTQKQMQEMQKHMKSLTNDFDRVVKNMDKIQKGNR